MERLLDSRRVKSKAVLQACFAVPKVPLSFQRLIRGHFYGLLVSMCHHILGDLFKSAATVWSAITNSFGLS